MYLILNKENDYKANKSKIEALELQYKGLTKLISTEEGQLNKTMLQNIKEKQDLTYNTLVSFYNQMTSIYASHGVDTNIDYDPIDTNAIFVEQKLLTYIMENENELTKRSNNLIKDMYQLIEKKIRVKYASVDYFPMKVIMHNTSNHFATLFETLTMDTQSSIVNIQNLKTGSKQQITLQTYSYSSEGSMTEVGFFWESDTTLRINYKLNSGYKTFLVTINTGIVGVLDLTFKENLKLNQINTFYTTTTIS